MARTTSPTEPLPRACQALLEERRPALPRVRSPGGRRDLYWLVALVLFTAGLFLALLSLRALLSMAGLLDPPPVVEVPDRRWGRRAGEVPFSAAARTPRSIWLSDAQGRLHAHDPRTGLYASLDPGQGPLLDLQPGPGEAVAALTAGGGVLLVDGAGGTPRAIFSAPESFAAPPDDWSDAALWQDLVLVGTRGKGLGMYDPRSRSWLPSLREGQALLSDQVVGLAARGDRLYVGTQAGVQLFVRDAGGPSAVRRGAPRADEERARYLRPGLRRMAASARGLWVLGEKPALLGLLDEDLRLLARRELETGNSRLDGLRDAVEFAGALWLLRSTLSAYSLETLAALPVPAGPLESLRVESLKAGPDCLWVVSSDRLHSALPPAAPGGSWTVRSAPRPPGLLAVQPLPGGAYLLFSGGGARWVDAALEDERTAATAGTLPLPEPDLICARPRGEEVLAGTSAGLFIYDPALHGFRPPLELDLLGKPILNVLARGEELWALDPEALSLVTPAGIRRAPLPPGLALPSTYHHLLEDPTRVVLVTPGGEVLDLDRASLAWRQRVGRRSSASSLADFTCLEHDLERGALRVGLRSGAVEEYDLRARSWSTLLEAGKVRGKLLETLPAGGGVYYRAADGGNGGSEVGFASSAGRVLIAACAPSGLREEDLQGAAGRAGQALAYTARHYSIYTASTRSWSGSRSLGPARSESLAAAALTESGPLFLTARGDLVSPEEVLARKVEEVAADGTEVWVRRGTRAERLLPRSEARASVQAGLGGDGIELPPEVSLLDAAGAEGKYHLLAGDRLLVYDPLERRWTREALPAPLVELDSTGGEILGSTAAGVWYRRAAPGSWKEEGAFLGAALVGGALHGLLPGGGLRSGKTRYFGSPGAEAAPGDVLAVSGVGSALALFLPGGIALYDEERRSWSGLPLSLAGLARSPGDLPRSPGAQPSPPGGTVVQAEVDATRALLATDSGEVHQLDLTPLPAAPPRGRRILGGEGPERLPPFRDGLLLARPGSTGGIYCLAAGERFTFYDPVRRRWGQRLLAAPEPIERLLETPAGLVLVLAGGGLLRWREASDDPARALVPSGAIPRQAIPLVEVDSAGRILLPDRGGPLRALELLPAGGVRESVLPSAAGAEAVRLHGGALFLLRRDGLRRTEGGKAEALDSGRPPELPGRFLALSHDLDPASGAPSLRLDRAEGGGSLYLRAGRWAPGPAGKGERLLRHQDRHWRWVRGDEGLSIECPAARGLSAFRPFDSARAVWAFDRAEGIAVLGDEVWTLSGGAAYRQWRTLSGDLGPFEIHALEEPITALETLPGAGGQPVLAAAAASGRRRVWTGQGWKEWTLPSGPRVLHSSPTLRWTRESGRTRLWWTGGGAPVEMAFTHEGRLQLACDRVSAAGTDGKDLFLATAAGIARHRGPAPLLALSSMELEPAAGEPAAGAPADEGKARFVRPSRLGSELLFVGPRGSWRWSGGSWRMDGAGPDPAAPHAVQTVLEGQGFRLVRDRKGLRSELAGGTGNHPPVLRRSAGKTGGGRLSFAFDDLSAIHLHGQALYARVPGFVLRRSQKGLDLHPVPGEEGRFADLGGLLGESGPILLHPSGAAHAELSSGRWEPVDPARLEAVLPAGTRPVFASGPWLWVEVDGGRRSGQGRLRKLHRTTSGSWTEVGLRDGVLETDRIFCLAAAGGRLWMETGAGLLSLEPVESGFRAVLDALPAGATGDGVLFSSNGRLCRRDAYGRFWQRGEDAWWREAREEGLSRLAEARLRYTSERMRIDLSARPPASVREQGGGWADMVWSEGRFGPDSIRPEGSGDASGLWLLSAQGALRLEAGADWGAMDLVPGTRGIEALEAAGGRVLALREGKLLALDREAGVIPAKLSGEAGREALLQLSRRVLVPFDGFWTWWMERRGGTVHVEVKGPSPAPSKPGQEVRLEKGAFPFDRILALAPLPGGPPDSLALATSAGICEARRGPGGGLRYLSLDPSCAGAEDLLAAPEGLYARTGGGVLFRPAGAEGWGAASEDPFRRRMLARRGRLRWTAVERPLPQGQAGSASPAKPAGAWAIEVEVQDRAGRWVSFPASAGWPYANLADLAARRDEAWVTTGVGLARVRAEGNVIPPASDWELHPQLAPGSLVFTEDQEEAAVTLVEPSGTTRLFDPRTGITSPAPRGEAAGVFLFGSGPWDWRRTPKGVRVVLRADRRLERVFKDGRFEDDCAVALACAGREVWALTRGGLVHLVLASGDLGAVEEERAPVPAARFEEATGLSPSTLPAGESDLLPWGDSLLVAAPGKLMLLGRPAAPGAGGEGLLAVAASLPLPRGREPRLDATPRGPVLTMLPEGEARRRRFLLIHRDPLRTEPLSLEFRARSRRFSPWPGERLLDPAVLSQDDLGRFFVRLRQGGGRALELHADPFFLAEEDDRLWCAGPEGLLTLWKESATRAASQGAE